jgi:hypothetical protein
MLIENGSLTPPEVRATQAAIIKSWQEDVESLKAELGM